MDALSQLPGRSMQRADVVDLHRWRAYYSYFGLDPEIDPPLAFHWLLFTELSGELRADGHPVCMQPLPELPFPRRMWAGGDITWRSPLAPGDQLTRSSLVSRAELKAGGKGRFLLVCLEHAIQAAGTLRVQERQDIVFLPDQGQGQGQGQGSARAATQRPFEAEWALSCSADSVRLFRYSALTLNSHRIHYDETYTRTVEGHPGLVVHGPLLASQLMHAAVRRRRGEVAARFSYRSLAPVYAGEPYRLVGRQTEGREELAVLGPDDGVRLSASMSFAQAASSQTL